MKAMGKIAQIHVGDSCLYCAVNTLAHLFDSKCQMSASEFRLIETSATVLLLILDGCV